MAKLNVALKLDGDAAEDGKTLFPILYKAFVEKDMSLLEVNPLIVMESGRLRVLDAKVSFDGNALFRHDDIRELRDETEEDAKEIEALEMGPRLCGARRQHRLHGQRRRPGDGQLMDIIKLYGKEPANFCDVGGGASKEKVAARVQDHHGRPPRRGHPLQHLRRHHEV